MSDAAPTNDAQPQLNEVIRVEPVAEAAPTSSNKGKGKAAPVEDDGEDDDEEDEEEDDEEEEEGDAEEVPIEQDEVDPSVIRSTRTRGAKVDYSSEEALKKAGYSNEAGTSNEDDEEEDAEFKDTSVSMDED